MWNGCGGSINCERKKTLFADGDGPNWIVGMKRDFRLLLAFWLNDGFWCGRNWTKAEVICTSFMQTCGIHDTISLTFIRCQIMAHSTHHSSGHLDKLLSVLIFSISSIILANILEPYNVAKCMATTNRRMKVNEGKYANEDNNQLLESKKWWVRVYVCRFVCMANFSKLWNVKYLMALVFWITRAKQQQQTKVPLYSISTQNHFVIFVHVVPLVFILFIFFGVCLCLYSVRAYIFSYAFVRCLFSANFVNSA